MVIVETQPAVDLNPLGQRQRIKGINPEGIGLAVGVRPVSVQPANRQVAHRMVEIHRRRGPGVNAIVGLVFPGKLHAGADVMAYRASIEGRGDIGLVGQNAVADIFGINQTRPAPGVDVIDIGAVILFAPPITAVKRYSCFTRDQRVVLRTVVFSVRSCSKRRVPLSVVDLS